MYKYTYHLHADGAMDTQQLLWSSVMTSPIVQNGIVDELAVDECGEKEPSMMN